MTRNLNALVSHVAGFRMGTNAREVAAHLDIQRDAALRHLRKLRSAGLLVRVGKGPNSRWTTPENEQATWDWFVKQLRPPPRLGADTHLSWQPTQRCVPVESTSLPPNLGPSSIFAWCEEQPSEGTKE